MAPTCLVEARGLVKAFNGLVAVDHIDFTVQNTECYGFLGPNGAGKTSTIRMIQCVSPMTGGALRVNGMEVGRDDTAIKARLGVVPQEDNLDEDLTVIDNLKVYAGYFDISGRVAEDRGAELLKFFHLDDRRNARLRSLSGGMRRRLVIARSLINEPELLILDEPTTGLDPQARHVIWDRVRNLKERGVTIILTTHYMEEAAQLCDRIAIMDFGKILLEGPPAKLVEEGIKGEVIEFRPKDEAGRAAALEFGRANGRLEKAGDTVIIFTERPDEVMRALSAHESHFFTRRKPTLEDLFLRATGRALREGA